MNILLIGNGAREHAMAEAIDRSEHDVHLFALAPKKNPGIDSLATEYCIAEVTNIETIRKFAVEKNIDIVIPGAEAPLAAGVVDALQKDDIFCFGPTQSLARLETSKSFTRDLLEKYDIEGNPLQKSFTNKKGLQEYIENLGVVVVKSDGLCGGKGVKLMGEHLNSIDEAYEYAVECIENDGGVVIEEKLEGQEFSYISIADGWSLAHTFAIQDHKRAFEGDEGPNTGGMGTYNDENLSLPFLTEEDIEDAELITQKVFAALRKETTEGFVGVMYGGFMKTNQGIKLIEYNARFGDPEAENIFSLLQTDFVDILLACKIQALGKIDIEFEKQATVLKYVTSEGYPSNTQETEITLEPTDAQAMFYYGGLEKRDGKLYGKGRIVAVVGLGLTLEDAEKEAEKGAQSIKGNVRYRKDIGTKKSLTKKIDHLKSILNS